MGELPQRAKEESEKRIRKEKRMANKNQKSQKQQSTPQPIAPATPLELSDEELEQVTGGADFNPQPDPPGMPAATGLGGVPSLLTN
jgi:mersacidin/lichenicidin family type 2 lantibiotic